MRRLVSGGAGMVAGLALVGAGAGAAVAAPTGGPIGVFASIGAGATGKIVLAGAIGDWGTTRTIDRDGKPDVNGNFVKVTLQKGTFEVDATALNKKLANARPQIASNLTCSVAVSATGPEKVFNGTGLYQGISGTANLTITFEGVGGRYQSGAKKGQCEQGNSKPLAMLGSVIGRGTVNFAQ